ncbi:hexameric tyrosine-coordinated heme protein [Litoreibacter halocynthiae]|uniref:hexameric tyrosine-coordinated heme protein n=1 Tax=Litoreibacter halocynthiae TaxID=1242689 RepID=UPI0024919441|nr:hexameric tyrosine-coordinated heme protein [Litoreibacter halocynthiae]
MSDVWLSSLTTTTPQEGYDLTVKLSRVAVKMTQPDPEIRAELTNIYEHDANSLILASSVVAMRFQTIAMANAYSKAS